MAVACRPAATVAVEFDRAGELRSSVDEYLAKLDSRPQVEITPIAMAQKPPGYPQKMLSMNLDMEAMKQIWQPREMQGMRATAAMKMKGSDKNGQNGNMQTMSPNNGHMNH